MKGQETAKNKAERLVIGLSGASGVAYGIRALEALRELGIESHLVMTKPAEMTIGYETKLSPKQVAAKADYSYAVSDIAAPIASGSFKTKGMIVAPCSVRSMSEIATGVTTSLLTRAADVMLKERRPLVLMVRETPLHLGHLRTMTALAGGILLVFLILLVAGVFDRLRTTRELRSAARSVETEVPQVTVIRATPASDVSPAAIRTTVAPACFSSSAIVVASASSPLTMMWRCMVTSGRSTRALCHPV